MRRLDFMVLVVSFLAPRALAHPTYFVGNSSEHELFPRDLIEYQKLPDFRAPTSPMANLSGLPPRPPGLGNRAFHGSQFRDFEKFGFTIGSPAVEVAPVFLFSRSRTFYVSFYLR